MDAFPAIAGVVHLGFVVAMFVAVREGAPVWLLVAMGLVYAVSISWNINGVAHNFIHHPYFRSPVLNRIFSFVQSVSLGTPQLFIEEVHLRHHRGNSDRQVDGDTVDWLSIYRHGHDGEAENPWSYTFKGLFRNDASTIYRELRERDPRKAKWAAAELALIGVLYIAALIVEWRFVVLLLLPSYYLGHSLSNLNGYYRHYGGNPDVPIAWGVSSYGKLYNFMWFNNGYHAEHHYRPNTHWTAMKALRARILEQQRTAGVHVIRPPHALGFLQRRPPT
jgi:fatty acid desaturase